MRKNNSHHGGLLFDSWNVRSRWEKNFFRYYTPLSGTFLPNEYFLKRAWLSTAGNFYNWLYFANSLSPQLSIVFPFVCFFQRQACLYKRKNSHLIELLLLFVAGITEEKINWCTLIWIIIWKPNLCLYGILAWIVFSEVLFKISRFLLYTHNLYRFRRTLTLLQQFNRQNWFCVVAKQLHTLQHFPFISGFPVSVSCFIGLFPIARKNLLVKIVEHNLEDASSDFMKQVFDSNTSLCFLSQSLSKFYGWTPFTFLHFSIDC